MRLLLALLCLALALSGPLMRNPTNAQAPEFDLVIVNGTVIDGSGSPGFAADIGIKGDRIVRVDRLRGVTSRQTRDAHGMIVAPGFIDMLGQSEQYLLIDPRGMSKVMMGVT